MTDFAFAHELRQRADRFFDRRGWIDTVLVVEIDDFNAQPLQAAFTSAPDVIRLTVHPADGGVGGIADDAEFRGQHNLITLAFDGAAH